MRRFCKMFFHPTVVFGRQDFIRDKFRDNNLRILVLSIFLMVEQIFYAMFIHKSGSVTQKAHLITVAIMFIYIIISIYFQGKEVNNIRKIHKIYEISFGFFGFLIAVLRSLVVQNNIFQIPTIFIAVIYGFAVIFYFNPLQSFLVYSSTSTMLLFLLPIYQPSVISSSYLPDIIANVIIAWIVSTINYHKYVKEFNSKKIIEKNNKELKEKTLQIEKMNEKLKDISLKDKLTDIYNRRKLDTVLKYEFNITKMEKHDLSVILLDLDYFKIVNDNYGHNVGDKVLIEIAKILKDNVRDCDTVGRWGGEEFLIICPRTGIKDAFDLSEKLRKIIAKNKFPVINNKTCSFGVARYKKGDKISDLVNRADQGLYRAKEKGKNRVEMIE